ncbi:hypothetical protein [Paraburkholderia caballeronis]|uniref:hypothetical protein n=1 Tax=Paraburkholderia caballeronis TaxID=416943 RepID=UPI001065500B|nr:hypothetical protein [Paraburkholderia caballeronis]TDV06063.1 hypothetical protein C7408_12444 [Paraburkholderia caballeronis]TDV09603.1 hypothetical protein C7406_12644 [Paraburkholderia caballeronis]TDV21668.1 hypothetical protein C7404_12144 [Paraburkholderia caballeronis]
MPNINQLSRRGSIRPQDQIAYWDQNNGQPRRAAVWDLIECVQDGLRLENGLLNASSLYALRRTQAESIAIVMTPTVITPWDANGASVLPMGAQSITLNVTTGLMQATRTIQACEFWIALQGSVPSPRVLTVQLQTGPSGGPLFASEFESVQAGTGAAQSFHLAGILQNPNNVNGQINAGDVIQLVASADAATTLSLTRASFIVRPLDGA